MVSLALLYIDGKKQAKSNSAADDEHWLRG